MSRGLFRFPLLMMTVLLVLWGSFAAASQFALRTMDSYQVHFYMFAISVIIMTIWFVLNGKFRELLRIKRDDLLKLILFAIPSYFYYLFYILSLKLVPAVEASMLNYTYPCFMVLLAIPMHRESLTGAQIASILLGFAGMAIVVLNGNIGGFTFTNAAGDILALGGAFCWALFSNLGKKNRCDPLTSNYVYAVVSLFLSTIALLVFSKPFVPEFGALSWTAWLGISNIVIAYYLWFEAIKSASTSLVAGFSFLTPFATLSFIVLLLGETLTLVQLSGVLLVVLGMGIQVAIEKGWTRRKRNAV